MGHESTARRPAAPMQWPKARARRAPRPTCAIDESKSQKSPRWTELAFREVWNARYDPGNAPRSPMGRCGSEAGSQGATLHYARDDSETSRAGLAKAVDPRARQTHAHAGHGPARLGRAAASRVVPPT